MSLSLAAMLLGVFNGLLYALHGSWALTRALRLSTDWWLEGSSPPSMLLLALAAATVFGMFLSSQVRKTFRLQWKPRLFWLRHATGGLVMGVASVLAAGGNDVLLLHWFPGFSPHALPAYLALVLGAATALLLARWIAEPPRWWTVPETSTGCESRK